MRCGIVFLLLHFYIKLYLIAVWDKESLVLMTKSSHNCFHLPKNILLF